MTAVLHVTRCPTRCEPDAYGTYKMQWDGGYVNPIVVDKLPTTDCWNCEGDGTIEIGPNEEYFDEIIFPCDVCGDGISEASGKLPIEAGDIVTLIEERPGLVDGCLAHVGGSVNLSAVPVGTARIVRVEKESSFITGDYWVVTVERTEQ